MTAESSTPPEFPIEITALTRCFGALTAVDRFSLSVNRGETLGLLGPNGAGKTTVIKMLTTLLEPTSGQAMVAGFDVQHEPGKVRRNIGYVPQMLSADGALTGRENLMLSARLYGVYRGDRKGRVDEALVFMGLADSRDRLVKHYSGGMVRRLEIAQAMLHRPRVLFLDEPTIGLDPIARRAVWDRLRSLRREYGVTVLLTTHDMEEADQLCDRVAILHLGKLAVVGQPNALKAAIGPQATLDDVFLSFSGGSIQEGGHYHDIRQTRLTAQRLG